MPLPLNGSNAKQDTNDEENVTDIATKKNSAFINIQFDYLSL